MHEIVSKLKSNVYVIYTNWRTCNLIRGIIVCWEYIQAFMWIWWNGYLNPVPWTSLTRLQFFSLGLRGLQLRLSGRDFKNCGCQLRVAGTTSRKCGFHLIYFSSSEDDLLLCESVDSDGSSFSAIDASRDSDVANYDDSSDKARQWTKLDGHNLVLVILNFRHKLWIYYPHIIHMLNLKKKFLSRCAIFWTLDFLPALKQLKQILWSVHLWNLKRHYRQTLDQSRLIGLLETLQDLLYAGRWTSCRENSNWKGCKINPHIKLSTTKELPCVVAALEISEVRFCRLLLPLSQRPTQRGCHTPVKCTDRMVWMMEPVRSSSAFSFMLKCNIAVFTQA